MFAGLVPYDSYQATSSPWLEKIPSHWRLTRVKSVLRERVAKGYPEEPLLAATQSQGVIRKSDYGNRTVTATKDLHLLKLVEVGDFVISLRSFQGGIERCYHRGIISPAYTVLTAKSDSYRDYLTYLFKSKPFVNALTLAVTGIREGQTIDYSKLAVELLPVLPAVEQVAIVKYLTHANARIDRAIAARRSLINLTHEQLWREAHELLMVMNHSGPRQDSGIPWVGSVPSVWKLIPARYLFRPVSRPVVDMSLSQLSLTRLDGLIDSGTEGTNTQAASDAGNLQTVAIGDFVLNKYRPHLGLFRWSRRPGLVTRNYTVLEPTLRVDRDYFEMLFQDPIFSDGFRINARGVGEGMSPLYTSTLLSMKMPLPSLDEQRTIVARITQLGTPLRRTQALATKEIALLREYRTRLNSDVITGQVDVRGVARSLPESNATSIEIDADVDHLEVEDGMDMSEG